jgi:hypothetical protein
LQRKKKGDSQECRFQEDISAEKAFFALFSQKIQPWALMPLKGHIIAGFRGLKRDW